MTNRLGLLVLLFLFSIPALSPLFTFTPTRSADGLLHLYRLVQLDALWRNGIFFSRWLPDLAYGYGMPLFNYYAPLVYYITTPLHVLGLAFPFALNVSLAAAMFVGAVGMFYFTRAQILETRLLKAKCALHENGFPKFAALLAALAFLYSPYLLFNALQRANLAEAWALAFAPFALWRFFVLVQKPNALHWSLAVLSFAAVMLSHNVTSFLFAPLLFFFTLACVISTATRRFTETSRRSTLHTSRLSFFVLFSALLLALALSCFFWLPALLERDFVQIARVIVTPDFDYRFHFVSPLELVSLLPRADTGRLNPNYPSTLGIVQIFLASVGTVFLFTRFRSPRALPFFALIVCALGYVALMLSFSQLLWDNVSLLSFVQLPMRLRGLVALCLAPIVGISIFVLPIRWRTLGACVAISAIVLGALPLLYPRAARDEPLNPTLNDMFVYEQRSGAFGTTSFGEYLPVWVQNLPDKPPFLEAYSRNELPDRLVIPEGVNVCGEQIQAIAQVICVEAKDSWHAIVRAFYFPGWSVTIDGQPIEITATPRTGLISFKVESSGTLRVEYVGTAIEHVAEWISIASALGVFGVFAFGMIQRAPQSDKDAGSSTFHRQFFLSLFFLALALIAFKSLYTDHFLNPFVNHYDGGMIWSGEFEHAPYTKPINFGNELQLIGFDVDRFDILGYPGLAFRAKRGEILTTTISWRALPPLQRDLSTFVHLTRAVGTDEGTILAQQDNLHPGNLPTTRWDLDAYIADVHTFEIPATLAPGDYQLRVGVYDPRTNTRLIPAPCCDFFFLAYIHVE